MVMLKVFSLYFIFSVHMWTTNKDLSVHMTEACGQCSAAQSGPLLDSVGVDYG